LPVDKVMGAMRNLWKSRLRHAPRKTTSHTSQCVPKVSY